jgi:hypothetical protein
MIFKTLNDKYVVPRGGALCPVEDERDFMAGSTPIVPEIEKLGDKVLLETMYSKPKQAGNECTAYSLWMMCATMLSRRLYKDGWNNANMIDGLTGIAWDKQPMVQWYNQKKYPATADEKWGDYSRSALRSLKKFGLYFRVPNNSGVMTMMKFTIGGYAQIKRTSEDWTMWKAKGHPIYFTKEFFRGAIDSQGYLLEKGTRVFYHQMWSADVGGDRWDGHDAINSWGDKWGKYKNGTAGIRNIETCLQPWIIYDINYEIL